MSRDVAVELKKMHETNPTCGICYNGKTAEEWYTMYLLEVRSNTRIKTALLDTARQTVHTAEQVADKIQAICRLIK